MTESNYLYELVSVSASRRPLDTALVYEGSSINYGDLNIKINEFSSGLMSLGLMRGERVGIFLDKCFETVIACFGATRAGCVFVPINPVLKPDQVAYILIDCNVRVLLTTSEQFRLLSDVLRSCQEVVQIVIVDRLTPSKISADLYGGSKLVNWRQFLDCPFRPGHRVIDKDMAAILYTSGSTGKPKGVVLSHRNMVVGAKSVASYLDNNSQDRLLAVLPLSFDAGFSQLTTAFHAGATVVLLNYLLPRDILAFMHKERITGLTAVPPLYIQLSKLVWPSEIDHGLRYFACTGGRMPLDALTALRKQVPHAKPYLMYGLTESFRSTYLHPDEIDRRPDSIGKAIPNAEVWVMRDDGTTCGVNEPGELVHRGALVGLGYWNDAIKTAERFKLLTTNYPGRPAGLQLPEYAVHSGDTVRQDEDGFLYFIGRNDEMIKVSGYRISPSEVEEVIYATQMVSECIAFAVEHPVYGNAIQVIAAQASEISSNSESDIKKECRLRMPTYMIPSGIHFVKGPLPRNPNGKIDRKLLVTQWKERRHSEKNRHTDQVASEEIL